MKIYALIALVVSSAAGCTATQDPYAVDAVAQLVPVGSPEVRITGPLEILGTGAPGVEMVYVRTVAAYHVQLPDAVAPWVRLYTADSCDPGQSPALYEDLGTIRRVGDETHFFLHDVSLGDRTVDIDTETVTAGVSLDPTVNGNVFTMIAVVQEPGDGSTVEGPFGEPIRVGGPWLACGAFVAP